MNNYGRTAPFTDRLEKKAMKGFGKRLGALTACLLTCLLLVTAWAAPVESCPGNCAHPAAVGTTHYDTLEEAVAAAEAGKTVTVLGDITLAAPITLEKSIVLDLGGKTLTGNLIFTGGGTVKNGGLTVAQGVALTVKNCTVAIEKDALLEGCGTDPVVAVTADKDKEAALKVSGTLTGKGDAPVIQVLSQEGKCTLNILKNAKITAEENAAIDFDAEGKLDISDGTIQGKKDLVALQIKKDRKAELSVTGGKLLSDQGEAFAITVETGGKAPAEFVTGGTYRKVPAAYVPDWCVTRDNGNGTYTVISSYTLTFHSGGASGSMDSVTVRCGSSYQLPKSGFTAPQGKDFAGWEIGGKTYQPGDSFTPKADTSLTALWKDHVHSGGKATCLKKAVCTGCGESYGKLGSHKLSASGGYAPACDQTGMLAHSKCGVCGSCFVNGKEVSAADLIIAAPGHSWENVEGKDATCTDDGVLAHRKCIACETVQVEGKDVEEAALVIPALGHSLEAVAATEASCSQPGIQAHDHCTVCDGQFVKDEAVQLQQLTTALAAHVLSDWESDESYHWKACVDCREVFRQSRHADKDADGSCDDCGYVLSVSQAETQDPESTGLGWLLWIPIAAAAVTVILLAAKKKKEK